MTNYGAIYAKASRENAPGLGRDNFDAGIAAVVAAAKAEAEAERDVAIAQRDASRRVNAEFLAARAAAEQAAALHDTSEHYTKQPMPDGEGE